MGAEVNVLPQPERWFELGPGSRANKQKPVNGKMGAAGRLPDNKMRTVISLAPARRRASL